MCLLHQGQPAQTILQPQPMLCSAQTNFVRTVIRPALRGTLARLPLKQERGSQQQWQSLPDMSLVGSKQVCACTNHHTGLHGGSNCIQPFGPTQPNARWSISYICAPIKPQTPDPTSVQLQACVPRHAYNDNKDLGPLQVLGSIAALSASAVNVTICCAHTLPPELNVALLCSPVDLTNLRRVGVCELPLGSLGSISRHPPTNPAHLGRLGL